MWVTGEGISHFLFPTGLLPVSPGAFKAGKVTKEVMSTYGKIIQTSLKYIFILKPDIISQTAVFLKYKRTKEESH